ncbi:molecular chaperone [Serratia microhaemolytica]|uniref:fimbrial biogenesis chaperone n=1 Tax=Serratia microhaemolytica TaxID=2675110 RepID=UPI000FDD6B04|nr:molecular chaperone [Serratia microhaemolytica]
MWKSWVVSAALLMSSASVFAEGGVSFSRNRMVLNEGEKAISISAYNHGEKTYLLQAGVSAKPDQVVKAPFVVTPPLGRLNPNGTNVLRIIGSGSKLPRDRESVFYFHATTIPAKDVENNEKNTEGAVGAQLSVAMKVVFKLFYRPKGLPITITQAQSMMSFVQQGKEIVIKNPTPYHQSFALLKLDGVEKELSSSQSMVVPMGEVRIPVDRKVANITWSLMNDYGGMTPEVTQPVVKE